MRARVYYFLTAVACFGGALLTWISGEIGYVLYGLMFGLLFMMGFAYVNQARAGADKVISNNLSISIAPDVAKRYSLPAVCSEKGGIAFEESWAIPLGGAKLNGLVIPDLREFGVAIVAKRLLFDLDGQFVILGHTIELRPHHRALYESLLRIKPPARDPREIIPQQWLAIITQLDRWRTDSPIFLAQDPRFAVILEDDPRNPTIEIPGMGSVQLRDLYIHGHPKYGDVPLGKLFPNAPVIDFRPSMAAQYKGDNNAIREVLGALEASKNDVIKRLEAQLTALTEIDDKVAGGGLLSGTFIDNALGDEESPTRRG